MPTISLGISIELPAMRQPISLGSAVVTNLLGTALSGVPLLNQPIVQVLNPFGVLDATYVGPVTMAATGSVLSGTTTVLAVAGVATFVGLTLTGAGTAQLIASVPQRLPGVSATITVT